MLSVNSKSAKPIFNNMAKIMNDAIKYNSKNVFTVFISFSNELILAYVNDYNQIVFYDLSEFKLLNKYDCSHNEIISFLKHFKDREKNRDILVSISDMDCIAKIWVYKKPSLSCVLDLGNIYNNGMIKGACFVPYDTMIYLLVINLGNNNNGDNIKLINIVTNKIFVFQNTNQPSNQIESFINRNKVFILVYILSYIKSYIFDPLSLTLSLYKKYIDKKESEHIYFEIFTHDGFQAKIIDSDNDGVIRIWDFDSCVLLHKIRINNNYADICLYNNYLLFLQTEGLKLMDIKSGKIVTFYKLSNKWDNIICIEHFKYGKCVLFKDKNFIGLIAFK